MDAKKVPKSSEIFNCILCDYKSSKYSQYHRHLMTSKHQKNANGCQKSSKNNNNNFSCECGNNYKFRQGLQKHKLNCKKINTNTILDLFKIQIEENKEIKQFILDQQKQLLEQNNKLIELSKNNSKIGNINTTNNNVINNKFNLNIFLNEKCKDALNINDFIDSIQLKLADLELVAKLGYIEGISKIFVKELKDLDVYKRPIHCSDIKRETLYIKDEDKWSKEDEEKKKVKQAIQQITHKNIKNISNWVEENPECKDSSNKKNDEYMKLISNSMSGECEEEQLQNINKIITNVAKTVTIDK
jgi:hypothetical protein